MTYRGDVQWVLRVPLRRPFAGSRSKVLRILAAWAVLGAVLGAVPFAEPAAAGPDENFSLTKTDNVGGEALIGEEVTYTITATGDHVSADPLYNLSFRDVLPAGVDFVSASPAPTAVLEDVPSGQTTVIWSNVSDLPAAAQASVQITVDTNPDVIASTVPVGTSITNAAQAVASLDPFAVPDYSAITGGFTGDFDGTATASRTVSIIPFRVTKTAPDELLRGVHGTGTDGALYTIEVENNPDYATNAVTLVDTLDPGLEFLGCDSYYSADNTTVGEEWTGSGPVATGAGCSPTPISVDTGAGGETIVTWDLSNLAPGQVATIQYQAGIPLFENRPFSAAPSAAGLTQGRNLDNNTGPSTGEPDRTTNTDPELLTAPEPGFDNNATATGTYTPSGATSSVTDIHTVESEDIIIDKSMTGSLTQGSDVVTTLTITTSEYRDFTDLVVRDLLPSALCFQGGFDSDITPGGSDWASTDCPAGVASLTTEINGTPVTAATVRELPDGGPYGSGRFEVVWDFNGSRSDLADLDADESLTITYRATVREFYRGGNAQLPGEPILAGDEVSNAAEVSGPDFVAAARPGLVADAADPDGGIDGDTASASIDNALPSINKRVSEKAGPLADGQSATGATCINDYGSITWADGDPAVTGFGPGDIVCFELGATFPAEVDFEGVQIQDILPAGYDYVSGSAARVTSVDTIIGTTVSDSGNIITFVADGTGNVEATGNEFRWVIAARLNDNTAGAANDINANLQKLTFNNNAGLVYQLRDDAAVVWAEPEVQIAKGVANVDGGTGNPADFDGSLTGGSTAVEVVEGQTVTFRVDVWNVGNIDATNTIVQDVLPSAFDCTDVTFIDGGSCAGGVITWTGLTIPASTGPGDDTPENEDTASLTRTYSLVVPSGVDPDQTFTNTAGVASYQGGTNDAGTFEYYPADNIDPLNVSLENTEAADDQAFLSTPAVTVSKLQRSAISEAGNGQNGTLATSAEEVTIGEIIQYQITAVIPEGTTVFDAQIRDVLPAGLNYFSGNGLFDGTVSNLQPTVTSSTGTSALTTGTVVNSSGTVTYDLPDPYNNAANSGDDSVTITFYAQVADSIGNQAAPTATAFDNRGRFDWDDAVGNDRADAVSSLVTAEVVEPNPVVVKDHTDPSGDTSLPGDAITYRITLTNPSATNVSVAHDVTIVDTVPDGITPLGTGGTPVATNGDLVPSTGVTPTGSFNGEWSETNHTITWTPADLSALDAIDPDGTVRFTYQGEVDDPSVSSSSLVNTAAITAYSLDQDLTPTDDPNEGDARTYTDTDSDTITVPLAAIDKDIEPFNAADATDDVATATIGEQISYELTVTIPDRTAAYDATIFDDLPSRLDLESFDSIVVGGDCRTLDVSTGLPTATALDATDIETYNPNGGDASVLAWLIGDVYGQSGCEITVQYTTSVNTVAFDTNTVTNSATVNWNDSDQVADSPANLPAGHDSPTSPSWTVASDPATETFTVVEPQLAIDKDVEDVSGATLINPTCDATAGNSFDADGTAANGCDTGPGETLRYTVVVTNNGTSEAHDISWIDTVPVGLTPLLAPAGSEASANGQTITGNSGSTGTWSQDDRTITWTATGPLATSGAGSSFTVDYDAVVGDSDDLGRGEDLANTASVDLYFGLSSSERAAASTASIDTITYGNGTGATRGSVTDDVVTVEVHFPDLEIVKEPTVVAERNDVRLDASFSWTVVVTNNDAAASAFNVDVADVLPVGWVYDANSARVTSPFATDAAVEPACSADAGSCGDSATLNTETLTWTDLVSGASQPLAPGETITIVFTATPSSAVLTPDQATGESFTGPTNAHTNNVTVTGEDVSGSDSCCDPDGAGPNPPVSYVDTDDDDVFIARADLSVGKAITPVEDDADPANGPYWFGSFVNYTITISNDGPDDATGVAVDDILDPTELEFVSVVSVDQGTFDDGTNVWTIGDIDDGESFDIVLRTRLIGLGSVTNIAQNSLSDQYDSDSTPDNDVSAEDDQDTVTIEVVPTSLGDYVWLDFNGDGVQDGDEPGIEGVEIDLSWIDPGGTPRTYTTVTGPTGAYGVPPSAGLPADTDITVAVDVANSPGLVGLAPSFDRDGTLDHTATEQITLADGALPDGTLSDLAFDFGYVAVQSFGDKIWEDQDNSGDASNGAGEPGLANIDVTATWFGPDGILGTGDDADFVETTDANGDYLFASMPAGDYRVVVDDADLPAGLTTQTFDLDGVGTPHTATLTLDPSEDQLDVDFSYRGAGSIGDTVWFDHDGDGVIDVGEPGIGGVTVTLDWAGPDGIAGNGDDVVLTTTTAADGTYRFDNLANGNFVITVDTATLPGNMAQTFDDDGIGTAHASSTTLSPTDPNDFAQDFGYRGLGSIGDTVFFDIDGTETDGALDGGDAPIEGVDVTVLWAGADDVFGTADDFSFTDTTDASGNYLVTELPHGDYTVTVDEADLPAGLTGATYDADGTGTASVSATTLDGGNPDDLDQDFAYTGETAGLIGDTVWFDIDADGVQDVGEVGFSGVDVTLVWFGPDGIEGTADDVSQVETTDADGLYLFDNLPEGDFRVSVDPLTLPPGLSQTFDGDGVGTVNESLVTLDGANPSNLDQDFGYTGVGSIGDTVWLDLDNSGTAIVDAGEPGLTGVDVIIVWTNPQGADVTYTATTDSSGMYLWPSAPYGDFTVTVDSATVPASLVPTYDSDGLGTTNASATTLDAVTPDDLDQDFSYAGTSALGDTVWQDDDADGVIDGSEPLLDGVTVTIDYTDPATGTSFTATTITAGGGVYGFGNLPAGDYEVTVDVISLPEGLIEVFDLDGTDTPSTATVSLGDLAVRNDVDFGYQPQTDIAIDKSHVGDFALGQENTWTIEVTNLGPATAQAPIVVVDTLPAGVNFVRTEGSGWDCTAIGQSVTCTLVDGAGNEAVLVALDSASVNIVVTLEADAAPGVVNVASVSTSSDDPNPDNDTDSDPTNVPLAVLEVDKVADGGVEEGREATYVITATNVGPSITTGDVVITDALPRGLRFVSATTEPSGSSCSFAADTVTCSNSNVLAVGDTWSVRVVVDVVSPSGSEIVNIGTVTGGNEVNGVDLPDTVVPIVEDLATVTVDTPGLLAFTGVETSTFLTAALVLLTLGSGLLLLSRRRKPATVNVD